MRAKKSLGQNFLINPKVAERIAVEANISKNDTVLEIGPGTGNLTKHLLMRAKKVIALEKDDALFEKLKETFTKEIKSSSLVLVHGDVLEFEVGKLKVKSYKVVANIPYNITGAILKKFLSGENKPESMTLMVQREVAERIMARDGKESLLSISVKAYGTPKILFKVGRGNFFPAPNVDSAVINIGNISRKLFTSPPAPLHLSKNGEGKARGEDFEERFWSIVKAGFAHKRKKLSGNLRILCQSSSVAAYGDKRAEDLSLKDWIALTKKCYN